MKWVKTPHTIWGKGGTEESANELVTSISFPKWIHRKGKCSIIEPCGVTFGQYELYDGNDTQRFFTLKDAKAEGDRLLKL